MSILDTLPVEIKIPLRTGRNFVLQLDLPGFIAICRARMLPGSASDEYGQAAIYEALLAMAYLGVVLTRPGPPTPQEKSDMSDVLSFFDGMAESQQWRHPDDPVFSVIVALLRTRKITRAEAAEIAAELMEEPKTVDQDAFRGRVNRWVAARGLPPIGQTKRRARGLSG